MATEPNEPNIVRPPDFVFKYLRRSRIDPSQEVVKQDGTFELVGIKYPPLYRESDQFFKDNNLQRDWFKYPVSFKDDQIYVHTEMSPLTDVEEGMGGQLACFKDVPFPYKGHPSPEAIYAVNVAKRFTRQMVEFLATKGIWPFAVLFALFTKKKKLLLLERFIGIYVEACQKAMGTYILKLEYMNKYGREIYRFVLRFLLKFGVSQTLAEGFAECFASQIDWDNAYWMRMGDAMAETSKDKMLADPRRELARLVDILVQRGSYDPGTAGRLRRGIRIISFMLYVPRLKRIFKECIEESSFPNFQFDDADRYHCLVFADYDYLGLSLKERLEKYHAYHVEHPPSPKRLIIQPA